MARITIVEDEEAVGETAAERVTSVIEQSVADRGSAVVCLTGGRTPRRLYELLADGGRPWRQRVDWTRVHLFWGDERRVPPDHPDSNFGMARRALLDHVPIPDTQVHRMRGEIPDARHAADEYEATLREGFLLAGRSDQTFDLMLLGLGEDGHIASIFPGSPLLHGDVGAGFSRLRGDRRVTAIFAAHVHAWRITLTPRALLDARTMLMMVSGSSKAVAVGAALELPEDIPRWPVQLLRVAGDRVEWIVDRPAAMLGS
jgi:6-phosphogluconolactonase